MNSKQLTHQFEQCQIEAQKFGHLEHIAVAFELLNKYDFLTVTTVYSNSIKTIAGRAGVDDKFNLTITLAFLSLIAERLEHAPTSDFAAFLDANQDLLTDNPLNQYYSKKRLYSDTARCVFLLPDL